MSFLPALSHIESCHVNTSFHLIWAECTYSNQSKIAGYQLIAQLNNTNRVQKLYTSKAVSPQTSVAISVDDNGIYQITIFAIRRGTGIVDTNVEYLDILTVNEIPSKQLQNTIYSVHDNIMTK